MTDTLLTASIVVVQKQQRMLSQLNDYGVFASTGERLGWVQERPGTGKAVFGKLANMQLNVFDAQKQPVLLVQRPGGLGRSHFGAWLADETELGTIDQENLLLAPQLALAAVDGSTARLTGGKMLSREWALVDGNEAPLGRVTKPWAGIAELFPHRDIYVVELAQTLTGPLRTLALAACLCLDVIRDERRGGDAVAAGAV